jgi:ankyrin repeat protein
VRLGSGTEDASARNKNGNGCIPLHGASQFGRLEVVLVLLEHGAHANDRPRIDELHWTPLHRASLGCLEVARVLLERGADADS